MGKIIAEYKKDYSLPGYKHIYDNISETMIHLISFIKAGTIHIPKIRKEFENEREAKIISYLTSLLEKQTLNPWYEAKKEFFNGTDNFIHPDERDLIAAFNASLLGENKEKFKIHTEIAPAPYYGNVFTAKIVLLALNPGFDLKENEKDESGKNFYEVYRDYFLMELTHEKTDLKYPLLFLNDEYIGRSPYWNNKLKSLYQDEDGKEIFGQRVCKIQFSPYTSLKYKNIPKKFFKEKFGDERQYLKTQEYSFEIVRKAMERNAIIVITRSGGLWQTAIPELASYTNKYSTKNPRNPYITPNNLPDGYEKIKEALSLR